MGTEFLDETFPVLVYTAPVPIDDAAINRINAWCEDIWSREERYTLVTYRSPDAPSATAAERRRLAEWANRPAVRRGSRRWCAGSATVVDSPLHRGTLTALLWIWKPPNPHQVVATADEGVEYCLAQLRAEDIPVDETSIRRAVRRHVASLSRAAPG